MLEGFFLCSNTFIVCLSKRGLAGSLFFTQFLPMLKRVIPTVVADYYLHDFLTYSHHIMFFSKVTFQTMYIVCAHFFDDDPLKVHVF